MSWRNGWRCIYCKAEVSYDTKMNSHGRCPHCGFKGAGSHTVMETEEFPYEVKPMVEMKGVVLRHRNRIGILVGIAGGVLSLLRAPWYVNVVGCILCFVAIWLVEDL